MMNDTDKTKKNSWNDSERLASCSVMAGTAGIFLSLLYLPISLGRGRQYAAGLICAAIGIVFAFMARNADMNPRRVFPRKAIAGIILSSIAIGLTFLFFYLLVRFYDALRDPVIGPQINAFINQVQEQMSRQLNQLPQ